MIDSRIVHPFRYKSGLFGSGTLLVRARQSYVAVNLLFVGHWGGDVALGGFGFKYTLAAALVTASGAADTLGLWFCIYEFELVAFRVIRITSLKARRCSLALVLTFELTLEMKLLEGLVDSVVLDIVQFFV